MIRASADDAERINGWIWRDSGKRLPHLDQLLSDRMNICLIEGEGGALFVWRGPGIYEAHVFFEQRGRKVLDLSRQMLRAMSGARLIWTAVPENDRKVKLYARWLGFKSQGHENLSHGPCELFILEL